MIVAEYNIGNLNNFPAHNWFLNIQMSKNCDQTSCMILTIIPYNYSFQYYILLPLIDVWAIPNIMTSMHFLVIKNRFTGLTLLMTNQEKTI